MDTESKKRGVTTYAHIVEILKKKIEKNEYKSGDKLPTERELAKSYGVSRTTISTVYTILQDEGFIVTQQGKGTYVKYGIKGGELPSRKEKIHAIIDDALSKALQLGFTVNQFQSLVALRIFNHGLLHKQLKIIIIDCNLEQTTLFADYIQKDPLISVQTILLEELASIKSASWIAQADCVITTLKHLQYVKEILGRNDIVAVATTPNLEALVKIATLSRSNSIGFVCSGLQFWEIFINSLVRANIQTTSIHCYNHKQDLSDFVHQFKVIAVTPLYEKRVCSVLTPSDSIDVVPFYFEMDAGSSAMIQECVAQLKKKEIK